MRISFIRPHVMPGRASDALEPVVFGLLRGLTPDDVGLTAQLARIVGAPRDIARDVCPSGSFVHLMGILHDSGGPGGGTAYFALRANIAAQTPEIRDEIAAHIRAWAEESERDRDVWTCSLDRPGSSRRH